MKRTLNLLFLALFLAGALTLLPAYSAMTTQSTEPPAANPQAKASDRASSHGRRHHGHSSTTRRHRHHKTSSKH